MRPAALTMALTSCFGLKFQRLQNTRWSSDRLHVGCTASLRTLRTSHIIISIGAVNHYVHTQRQRPQRAALRCAVGPTVPEVARGPTCSRSRCVAQRLRPAKVHSAEAQPARCTEQVDAGVVNRPTTSPRCPTPTTSGKSVRARLRPLRACLVYH